jgi:cell division septation protein DedD
VSLALSSLYTMHRLTASTVVALAAAASFAASSGAQSIASSSQPPLPAADSIFQRARRLVSEGDGATGRAVIDSMLRAATEGTPAYGDALFWRGALAETAADAERDYRRVIVEYALSPYADDALLSLAELEQARGDRTAAYQHLQRFVREHPMGLARARAGLAAARLAFEQRDVKGGCAMITDARLSAGSSDVELRNQIDYHGARCPTATVSAPAPATSAPVPSATAPTVRSSGSPSGGSSAPARPASSTPMASPASATAMPSSSAPRADTTAKRAAAAAPPRGAPATSASATKESATTESSSRGIWTIQLAAYNTRSDAETLVRKLAARGVKARISGDAKPFRVRLDHYDTRQDAAARVAELKQRGIIGFVTDEPRSGGASRP